MASDYPVMITLAGRRCVVVGAGPVGLRKVGGLLAVAADVVLVDPGLGPEACPDGVTAVPRPFHESDLDGAALVFAATDNEEINRAVAEAARARSIPVNVADGSVESDFTLPALARKGHLTLAVSTDGMSPAVARMVRDEIGNLLPGAWAIFLEIAAGLRRRRLTSDDKAAYNQQVLQNLVSGGILALIERGDAPGIDRLIEKEIGEGLSLADLDISLPKGSS